MPPECKICGRHHWPHCNIDVREVDLLTREASASVRPSDAKAMAGRLDGDTHCVEPLELVTAEMLHKAATGDAGQVCHHCTETTAALNSALSPEVSRLIEIALEMQAEWDASLDDEGDSMCLPNSPKHAPSVADVLVRFEAERKGR